MLLLLVLDVHAAELAGLTAGSGHACAWYDDGAVYCWGENDEGQLGMGDYQPHAGALRVRLDTAVTQVVATGASTCAIDERHRTFCWGKQSGVRNPGKRGREQTVDTATPMPRNGWGPAARLVNDCIEVVGGGHQCPGQLQGRGPTKDRSRFRCAIDDGQVRCERGLVDDAVAFDVPGPSGAVDVDVVFLSGCAAGPQGSVCFDADGVVTHELPAASHVAVGPDFVCLGTAQGVQCIGGNQRGQLGVPAPAGEVHAPVDVGIQADELAIVGETTCVRAGDAVSCWSAGTTPVKLDGLGSVDRLTASDARFCVRGERVHCWEPGAEPEVWDVDASVHLSGTCAIGADDRVQCIEHEPRQIPGALRATANRSGFCAFTGEQVECVATTGFNAPRQRTTKHVDDYVGFAGTSYAIYEGEVRDWRVPDGGATHERHLPEDIVHVWPGKRHVWYRTNDGRVWSNQWGHETYVDAFPALQNARELASGPDHSCAVLDDGAVRCLGRADLLGTPVQPVEGILQRELADGQLVSVPGLP